MCHWSFYYAYKAEPKFAFQIHISAQSLASQIECHVHARPGSGAMPHIFAFCATQIAIYQFLFVDFPPACDYYSICVRADERRCRPKCTETQLIFEYGFRQLTQQITHCFLTKSEFCVAHKSQVNSIWSSHMRKSPPALYESHAPKFR